MTMKIIKKFFKENSILNFFIFSMLGIIVVVVLSIKYSLYMYQIMYILLGLYFILKSLYINIFGVNNDWFACTYFKWILW